MTGMSQIEPGAEVISADGISLGSVDRVEGDRLKLTPDVKGETPSFVDSSLIADIGHGVIRLSAIAAIATSQESAHEAARHENERLDEGLEETFPASDPVSAKHIT